LPLAKTGVAVLSLLNVNIADYFLVKDNIGKDWPDGDTHHKHRYTPPRGFFLGRVFRAIGTALITLTEANARVRRAEELQSLSDAELAKRGLKREDIARHVFGDMFYI